MYDRTPARSSRRRRSRLGGRRWNGRYNNPRAVGWAVALILTASVIGVGLHLATGRSAGHLTPSADVQGMHGWGHGGFPMMPGYPGTAESVLGTKNAADQMSSNWAGYAATGQQGSFTSVSASWAEPAVTCGGSDTFSAFWVGLDGDGTPTVEQTGTEADCANGAATYQGWYEIFPNAPVFFNNPVQPADAMNASVQSDGNGLFTLTLSDTTQGWTQTTQQSEPSADLGSAEIIAEAPSDGDEVLPLSDFGTVNFSNVAINNQALGNENPAGIAMVSENGTALATPSALSGGNAFSVTDTDAASGGTSPAPSASPSPSPTSPGTGSGGSGFGSGGHRHHHHGSGSGGNDDAWLNTSY